MKTILKSALHLMLVVLLFTACQKETVQNRDDNATASDQSTVASASQNDLAQSQKIVSDFGKSFSSITSSSAFKQQLTFNPNIVFYTKLPIFSALNAALVKTNLTGTLSTPNLGATVFAPTDAAFAELPAPYNNAKNIAAITDQTAIANLANILLYHVLGAEVKSGQIADGRSSAETLKPKGTANDNTIYLSKQYGLIAINGSTLVLVPNITASNGIIHVINHVLIPPSQTIAGIATGNPAFSSLVAALVKTNLVSIFQNEGDFTVFAPTDNAFSQLPEPFNNAKNIEGITDQAQIDALSNILKYHVLGERYFTLDLGVLHPVTTLAAAPNNKLIGLLGITRGYVKGNQNTRFAIASPANLLATNGVVHVIDKVLQP